MRSAICMLFDYEMPDESIPNIPPQHVYEYAESAIGRYFEDRLPSDLEVSIDVVGIVTGRRDSFSVEYHEGVAQFGELDDVWTFQYALDFATQCVALDFGLFGADPWHFAFDNEGNRKIEQMGRADLLTAIFEDIPHRLVDLYGELADDPLPHTDKRTKNYKRMKMAKSFEYIHDATYPPFAEYGTPYEHRAFDIRGERDAELDLDTVAISLCDCRT